MLATQNPIEHEGTYPLPEAQLDRFMFNTYVDYPEEEEEFDIVQRTTADIAARVRADALRREDFGSSEIVRRVPVADHVVRYAMKLVRLTRPTRNDVSPAAKRPDVPPFIRDYVSWGAGPRASQYLVLGAKARAVLHGRFYAGTEDIRAVAFPVLRHRIVTNFNAEAEGVKPDDVIRRLIEAVGDVDAGADEDCPPCSEGSGRGGWKREITSRAKRPTAAGFADACPLAGADAAPRGGSSRATCRASTAARSTVSRSSSPSIASTPPGDDLRYLDWKVFGRTDRYYLKQFEEETNLVCHLLLDTSESMRYRSDAAPMSKLEYAQRAAAALAYLRPPSARQRGAGHVRQRNPRWSAPAAIRRAEGTSCT